MLKTLAASLSIACACAGAASAQDTDQASARFIDTANKEIGTATLAETPNGVLIEAELSGLPPGEHAFHIHKVGSCDPETEFKSAGGHYAPRSNKHGYAVGGGPHAGDMPNQFVGKGGTLHAEAFNSNVTLKSGPATLFDQDGSALVIHAGTDDYRSQPSGDAGSRLACAVINKR